MNKCRKFDTSIILNRFYVIKNKVDSTRNGARYTGELRAGEKLRPIGCPDYPSRVIARSLTDLVYACFLDKFNAQQHGFRLHRGTHTAISDIVDYLKDNPGSRIYEFDLKSFFNFVSPYWVHQALMARDEMLANLVLKAITNVGYTFKELKEEAELTVAEVEGVNHIIRRGLPQGLSLSPLLSTLAIEQFTHPKGLFMYADDGVFIGDNEGLKEFFM